MSAPKSVTITLSDPEYDHDDWRAFARKVEDLGYSGFANQIEAQLPKPKPAEPKGLGAVVKDRDGVRFVCGDPLHSLWRSEFSFMDIDYSAIDVVEVLSEGVVL